MNTPTIDSFVNANTIFNQFKSKLTCIKSNEILCYFQQLQQLGIPLSFKDASPHPLIVLMNHSDTPIFYDVLKSYILFYMPIEQVDAVCTDVINGIDLSTLLFNIQRKRKIQVTEHISKYSIASPVTIFDYTIAHLYIWTQNVSIKDLDLFEDYERIDFVFNSIDYMLQYTLSNEILCRISKVVEELVKHLLNMDIINTTSVYLQYKCIQYLKAIYKNGAFGIKVKSNATNILSSFLYLNSYFLKSPIELSNASILAFYKSFLECKSSLLLDSDIIDELWLILNDSYAVSLDSDSLDSAFDFVKSTELESKYKCNIVDAMGLNRFDGKQLTNLVTATDALLFRIILQNANLYDSKSHYSKVSKLFYASEQICQDPLLFMLLEHHGFLTEAHLFKSNIIETAGIEWITTQSTPYFMGLCDVFDPSINFTSNYDNKPEIRELLCAIIRLNRAFYANVPIELIVNHGVVPFLVVLLSSLDQTIQSQARYHLEYIVNEISRSKITDKKNIVIAINKVRNYFEHPYPNEEGLELQSVPYSFAYFVAIAMTMPNTHFMYTSVMYHLYKSPIYQNEPPLFQSLFHEPNTVRRKHRLYIIELLVKGMKSYLDKKIYYKWHVMDVLNSFKETFVCTKEEEMLIKELQLGINKY